MEAAKNKYQDYKPLRFTDEQIQEARNFPISELIANYGLLHEANKTKQGYFIINPFQAEKTPSFLVNTSASRNYAKAFNSGNQYNPITFVMEYENLAFHEAVRKILRISKGQKPTSNNKPMKKINSAATATAPLTSSNDLEPLTHEGKIINLKYYYLKLERFISPVLAENHGLQMFNRKQSKEYYLGFFNDKKGVECFNGLRNKQGKHVKKCFGQKGITTFLNSNKTDDFTIFEAYLDYLSFLTLHKKDDLKTNVIVLNGVELANEAVTKIKQYKPSNIYLALDNDTAGQTVRDLIKNSFKCTITDLSYIYKDYKDLNEMLQDRQKKNSKTKRLKKDT